jgi:sec-independent protein translocase protein TatC
MSTPSTPPISDQEMSLVGHLLEFRDRLVRSVIAIIIVFLVLFPFANDLYSFMAEPLTTHLPQGSSMMAIGVISPFLTPLKLALIASIFLSMPFLLYQLWGFIAPALYHSEKRLAAPMLIASTFLFYAGGAFVFYIVFPLVFKFMAGTTPDGVQIGTDIQLYLDFVIGMFFAFGLAFQVPVITVLFLITGMVSPEKMRHARPYVIVGAFTIAAFITPPDVISQTLLAVPMWFMYEAGLWFGERMVNQRIIEKEKTDNNDPTPPAAQQTQNTPPVAVNALAQDVGINFANSNVAIEPPKDAIIDNALDSDEDFERAFAQMDNERAALTLPVDEKKQNQ